MARLGSTLLTGVLPALLSSQVISDQKLTSATLTFSLEPAESISSLRERIIYRPQHP